MKYKIDPSILKYKDIEELELSVLSYNSLKRAGLNSVFEVIQIVEEDNLTKIRNIGEKAEQEIINKAEKFLIRLGDNKEKNSVKSDLGELTVGISPEYKFPNNISIGCLENDLGERLVHQLMSIGIKTIGDLDKFVSRLLSALKNNGNLVNNAIDMLEDEVKGRIKNSGLQASITVEGKKLYSILYQVPKSFEEKLQKYNALQSVLKANSLNEELLTIYEGISDRDKTIFVKRTLINVTYKDLGDKFNISRERVRQIHNRTIERISEKLKDSPSLFLQSACLIADNMGEDLTEEKFRKELMLQGMIAHQNRSKSPDTFELMLALIMNPEISVQIELKNIEYE